MWIFNGMKNEYLCEEKLQRSRNYSICVLLFLNKENESVYVLFLINYIRNSEIINKF